MPPPCSTVLPDLPLVTKMFFPFETLPHEIFLGIFECLVFKDLGRCLQVSKLFRKIALDETLWQTIKTVDKDVSARFLMQALTYGTKHLSLKSTLPLFVMPGENVKRHVIFDFPSSNMKAHSSADFLEFPKQNQLKTLNFHIGGDKNIVSALLDSCQSLEKLYINRISQFQEMTPILSCVFYNGQSLRILNFGDIHLDFAGIQVVCDNCIELKELAVNLEGPGTVAYLCQNLTTKIKKLRIATARLCRDHHEQEQVNCIKLSKRCNELIALSITGFDLTIIGITSIMKHLSKSLEKIRFGLDIFPWRNMELIPLAELHRFECQPMPNLTNVYILGVQMTFHPQILQLFGKELPNVKVMLSDYKPKSQMIAFSLFCVKHRASVTELHPNLGYHDITEIIGESWHSLTEEEQLPFGERNDFNEIAIPDN